MDKKMKVAVVGCGAISDIYLTNMIERFDNLEVGKYKITATLSDGTTEKKKVEKTINIKNLDDMSAYLFVHFVDTQEDATREQIYFSVSKDGKTWTTLNNKKPYLTSNVGTQGVRDPYILRGEDGKFFIIATDLSVYNLKNNWTAAAQQGSKSIVVWESSDLVNWSEPKECFNSAEYGLNREVNWAPEVHKYKGEYYMLATFTQENGLRGSYVLKAENPLGMFEPYSDGALTPEEWECLDATLYVSKSGEPYLVFCHEHTQIIDGEICFIKLNKELNAAISLPTRLFAASSPYWADKKPKGEHYITDGPFMYRTKEGKLLLIWSTFVNHKYCQCVARSSDNELNGVFEHLPLLIDNDGGHGMIFKAEDKLYLSYHTPNTNGLEHPKFTLIKDNGKSIELV